MWNLKEIDNSWTLFLDRDGVINRKRDNDYVKNLSEFEWLPNAVESIVQFGKKFGLIIIVTNQQGIGKGLMSENDLNQIHSHLKNEIEKAGGRIDAIYFAPQLKSENSSMRKPETGMAQKAKTEFKNIDFSKSIMVGDSLHDMDFGKRLGMKTIFISSEITTHQWIDLCFQNLNEVAVSL